MSTSSRAKVLNVSLKRRSPVHERTVHELLSDLQTAYTVFVPKPDDWLRLFQIIFLLPDRPKSPRNTNKNLHDVIQDHLEDAETDYQRSIATSFLEELQKVGPREVSRVPMVHTVSEESLRRAGFTVSTPGPSLGLKGSKSKSTHRSLRLSLRSSDTYTGRKLQRLIWKHSEEVFCLILQELQLSSTHVSTIPGDKSLMGIVTRRLISDVGVSRMDGRSASGTMEVDTGQGGVGVRLGGDNGREFREVYDDLHGVSGIHFIVFPIECLDMHRWRFYRGIDVCDSEMDESSSPDSLRRDGFYQASQWLSGTGSLNNAVESNSKTVTDEDSMRSVANSKNTTRDGQNAEDDREYVDVANKSQMVPFKDIDIRPVLSKFAMKQCKLAAFYRKMDPNNYEKTTRAVGLLRSALRKCRFESTIRALYDLSGCYLRGLGVQEDSIMGRLLRYCAGGMRRNYDRRGWWLRRLVTEIGFRPDEAPERSIGAMALLSHWRPVVSQEEMRNYLEQLRDEDLSPCVRQMQQETENASTQTNGRKRSLRLPPPVKCTVFISHAEEDKATIAIPLRESLLSHNITAFVDEADLKPHDQPSRTPAPKRMRTDPGPSSGEWGSVEAGTSYETAPAAAMAIERIVMDVDNPIEMVPTSKRAPLHPVSVPAPEASPRAVGAPVPPKVSVAEESRLSAMETAEIAVIVLSPEYLASKESIRELMCFQRRRAETLVESRCLPLILPFFYRLSPSELYDEPRLQRLVGEGRSLHARSQFFKCPEDGDSEVSLATDLYNLKSKGIMSIRNDYGVSNDSGHAMQVRRDLLVQVLCEHVRKIVSQGMGNTKEFVHHGGQNIETFWNGSDRISDLLHGQILPLLRRSGSGNQEDQVGEEHLLDKLSNIEQAAQQRENVEWRNATSDFNSAPVRVHNPSPPPQPPPQHSVRTDIALLKLVVQHNPYGAPHGVRQQKWRAIADSLREAGIDIDFRRARDRTALLLEDRRDQNLSLLLSGSGNQEDQAEKEHLLDQISNIEQAAKPREIVEWRNATSDFNSARVKVYNPSPPPQPPPQHSKQKRQYRFLKRQYRFSVRADIGLLKLVVQLNPYGAPHGGRLHKWQAIADSLRESGIDIDFRRARDRTALLLEQWRDQDLSLLRRSGSGNQEDQAKKEHLLDQVSNIEQAAKQRENVEWRNATSDPNPLL